jgi:hypothetical protein
MRLLELQQKQPHFERHLVQTASVALLESVPRKFVQPLLPASSR